MLIGLTASYPGVDIRFRAVSSIGTVERHVELSWEEAQDLARHLAALFQEHAKDPAEEDRWRDLAASKNER